MSLLLLEWFAPSWATALTFGGTFRQKCNSSVYIESLSRTNNVLNLLAIYAINCGTLNLWASTLMGMIFFLTIALFCRVFAISCVILVLLTFTSCVLLSNIDSLSLNKVRQVSKGTLTHPAFLHRDSALFLRVHGHVSLLWLSLLCDLPDFWHSIPA